MFYREHGVAHFHADHQGQQTGSINDSDLLAAYREFLGDERLQSGYRELADTTEADISCLTTGALQCLTSMVTERLSAPFRTAIIAPRDVSYGIGRMYES